MDIFKNNVGLTVGAVLTLGLCAFLLIDASKRSSLATKYAHQTIKQISETNALLTKSYPAKVDGEMTELEYAITPETEKMAADQSAKWKKAVSDEYEEFKKFKLKEPKKGLGPLEFSDGMIDQKETMLSHLKQAGIKLGERIPLLSFGEWINSGADGKQIESEMIPLLNRRLQVTKEIVRLAIATKVKSIDDLSWPELVKGGKIAKQNSDFNSGRRQDTDEDDDEEDADEEVTSSITDVLKWIQVKVKVTGDQDNVFAFMNAINKSKVIMTVVRDFKIEAPNEFKVKEPVAERATGNFGLQFENEEEVELKRENYKLDLQQTCSATLSVDVIEVNAKQ